ncbi:MAG: hypothetical protein ABIH23_18990 [bacterium]
MRKEKTRFRYQKRAKEDVKKRTAQSGGLFDSITQAKFQTFTPKEGDYRLRFLPPTWENPEHFGLDVYVHYGIGSDNQSYLCLDKMKGEKCPICEERKRAEKSGDPDYARTLQATKRVLVWVIDREDEDAGPLLWSMAWTIDRDLANLSIDKRTGEYLALDDPDEGFDIEFSRTGKGLKTKYVGIQVARKSTPLADDPDQADEWLEFVTENPLSDVLNYFDYDHVASVAQGKVGDDDDENEEEEQPRRRTKLRDDEDEDEEDEPRPSRIRAKSAKSGVAGKTARISRSDDDEDEDDEDDEPPVKKNSSRPPVDNDDEAEDDEEDDEEEEERPRSRRSR